MADGGGESITAKAEAEQGVETSLGDATISGVWGLGQLYFAMKRLGISCSPVIVFGVSSERRIIHPVISFPM